MPCERLLYVMRHGLTNWNQSRRIQGHLDPPLNATGRAQARLAGLRLARAGVAALYSSDLQRACETATLVGRAAGLRVVQNVGLREINFGIWQGLSSQEIRQRHPDVYAARRDNPYDVAPAGAETWRQFYDRAVQTVKDILAAEQAGPVVLVTHSGVCTVLGLRAQGLDCTGRRTFESHNCGIHTIAVSGERWRAVRFNDTSHMVSPS
ncbi:MAG: histidine phosphatase family protein [Candidatus Tectomicrobia bacterium]|nr:histidine phosphatase family protein [Candidatus Tectomicrobia bacterium]